VERNSRTLENLCWINHVQIPRRENEDISTSSDEQQQSVNGSLYLLVECSFQNLISAFSSLSSKTHANPFLSTYWG
jgi:hypothetical protein